LYISTRVRINARAFKEPSPWAKASSDWRRYVLCGCLDIPVKW